MNFRKKQTAPVNMDELARHIISGEMGDLPGHVVPRGPELYAPPHVRNGLNGPGPAEEAVEHIETFGALPTKELDEIVAAAEAEITNLKRDAQAVRDLYVKHTSRIAADIKRLHEGVRLSIEMMDKLRAQCIQLDQVTNAKPSKNGKPKVEDDDRGRGAADHAEG